MKQNNGITLISLVITIIVMLILAGVTVVAVINGGLIGKAGDARDKWNDAQQNELNQMDDIEKTIAQYTGGTSGETISKDVTEMENNNISYIGYFADVDNDGEVDGVIFADLLVGTTSTEYTINTIEDASTVKNYEVIKDSYTVPNASGYASKPVLKATGDGVDRFYVMALEDFTKKTLAVFTWYSGATDDDDFETANDLTSDSFGTGFTNTQNMIDKWTDTYFGYQSDTDIFKYMEEKISSKWFLPSRYEWSAFIESLGANITKDSEFATAYGFTNSYYWTSSKSREYVYFR